MNRKNIFLFPNGHEGMIVDCGEYEVEFAKSKDMERYAQFLKFRDKKTGNVQPVFGHFIIDFDKESDGGKLTIKWRDRWVSEMIFIHYNPSDVKGMFDFIGKGYNVFENLYREIKTNNE